MELAGLSVTGRMVLFRAISGAGHAASLLMRPSSLAKAFSLASLSVLTAVGVGTRRDALSLVPPRRVPVIMEATEYLAGLENLPVLFFLRKTMPIRKSMKASAMKIRMVPTTIAAIRSTSLLFLLLSSLGTALGVDDDLCVVVEV